jgi:hypothetical protein
MHLIDFSDNKAKAKANKASSFCLLNFRFKTVRKQGVTMKHLKTKIEQISSKKELIEDRVDDNDAKTK